jgi:hypothetical protein
MNKIRFVSEYPIDQYRCGLKAGDKVRLKRDIVVHDSQGKPTGGIHRAGEVWRVLPGAKSKPIVVWLLQADGQRHTWGDDKSIFETFEQVEE